MHSPYVTPGFYLVVLTPSGNPTPSYQRDCHDHYSVLDHDNLMLTPLPVISEPEGLDLE